MSSFDLDQKKKGKGKEREGRRLTFLFCRRGEGGG
jgi:hypothetical protein